MFIVRKRIQKKQFKSMIKITYGSNLIHKKIFSVGRVQAIKTFSMSKFRREISVRVIG